MHNTDNTKDASAPPHAKEQRVVDSQGPGFFNQGAFAASRTQSMYSDRSLSISSPCLNERVHSDQHNSEAPSGGAYAEYQGSAYSFANHRTKAHVPMAWHRNANGCPENKGMSMESRSMYGGSQGRDNYFASPHFKGGVSYAHRSVPRDGEHYPGYVDQASAMQYQRHLANEPGTIDHWKQPPPASACFWGNCPLKFETDAQAAEHIKTHFNNVEQAKSELRSQRESVRRIYDKYYNEYEKLDLMEKTFEQSVSSQSSYSADSHQMDDHVAPSIHSSETRASSSLSSTNSHFRLSDQSMRHGDRPSDISFMTITALPSANTHKGATRTTSGSDKTTKPGQQSADITFVTVNALSSNNSIRKTPTKSPEKGCRFDQETNMSCFKMETSSREIEQYKHKPGKPPFSYATLIGKAILESPAQQLNVCHIYSWISSNFPYYKSTDHSWKNAVRRNLSLHKFFIRVENDRGSVWTLDQESYSARRTKGKIHEPNSSLS
eukprot:Nk52_evm30s2209 gene=Nk52_evmTU30s2209